MAYPMSVIQPIGYHAGIKAEEAEFQAARAVSHSNYSGAVATML